MFLRCFRMGADFILCTIILVASISRSSVSHSVTFQRGGGPGSLGWSQWALPMWGRTGEPCACSWCLRAALLGAVPFACGVRAGDYSTPDNSREVNVTVASAPDSMAGPRHVPFLQPSALCHLHPQSQPVITHQGILWVKDHGYFG